YLHTDTYLPSLTEAQALVDGVVAIDTSCSIREAHLRFMAGACEDILSAFPQSTLQVVYCDTRVRSTEQISSYDAPITLSKAEGGGGTRFTPVFDWVAEQGLSPTFLLYMTDLQGDSPKDPGYPVVWLAIDGPQTGTPTFGHRIDLSSIGWWISSDVRRDRRQTGGSRLRRARRGRARRMAAPPTA